MTENNDLMAALGGKIDSKIEEVCEKYLSGPAILVEAMRYSLQAGGKRIRPILVLLSAEICGGDEEKAMIPAVALEMIHTFSLIHDDLPAMDNDDLRRGRPTSHKVFGEAMAILAGDALLAFAFELIATHYQSTEREISLLTKELSSATGPSGMTGGQVLDMTFEKSAKTLSDVENIHHLKTAALIRCACRMGAISASADKIKFDALSLYGQKLGLAFQVVDDLLDQTSSVENMGKNVGKDHGGKPNYALICGDISQTRQRAETLIAEAVDALSIFGNKYQPLIHIANLVLKRKS
jgi:geranylgeranyl diphosphate synthase type II